MVNLGTNDNSFCTVNDGAFDEFEAAYYDFLQTVHRCHPEAFIIASIGIIPISAELTDRISKAVERFKKNDSQRISEFRFTSQNGDLGFGSNWHPSEDTHEYAAEEFVEYIRSLGIL
ncbi:MAG: Endoglucanase E precursor [Firmicutes bacterium ADurb.BinA205]|nr:MAG: Endoglucanase E precursor [Firmicutes bacterium ADurb.BinA205]